MMTKMGREPPRARENREKLASPWVGAGKKGSHVSGFLQPEKNDKEEKQRRLLRRMGHVKLRPVNAYTRADAFSRRNSQVSLQQPG